MSQQPNADTRTVGHVIVRTLPDGRTFYYTHTGNRREERWHPNLTKARVYDDPVKARNTAQRATVYTSPTDKVEVGTLSYTPTDIIFDPPSP